MARELRAEDIAHMVAEPDWDNSDTSLDEDDDYFQTGLQPLDPLQQAQNISERDEETAEQEPQVTSSGDEPTDETGVTSSTVASSSDRLLVPFDSTVGPAIEMPSTSTALDFFNLTFEMISWKCLYSKQICMQLRTTPSDSYKWYDTTLSKMYLFLGIIIAMGVHKLPYIYDYWSSDCLLGVPGISAGKPVDWFKVLLWCFHLNDNSTSIPHQQPCHDRLHKIRSMIEWLREIWRTVYHPPREQSIDEAVVGFKDRSAIKQYMPMKPTKRSYKV